MALLSLAAFFIPQGASRSARSPGCWSLELSSCWRRSVAASRRCSRTATKSLEVVILIYGMSVNIQEGSDCCLPLTVEGGRVFIRDWREQKSSRADTKRKPVAPGALKTRSCWFFNHHPQRCPLQTEDCAFAHGPDDLRPLTRLLNKIKKSWFILIDPWQISLIFKHSIKLSEHFNPNVLFPLSFYFNFSYFNLFILWLWWICFYHSKAVFPPVSSHQRWGKPSGG